jgi:hypothetical protein
LLSLDYRKTWEDKHDAKSKIKNTRPRIFKINPIIASPLSSVDTSNQNATDQQFPDI